MAAWNINIEGASNVISTLTLPAEAGRIHIVEYISASLVCDNVAPTAINKLYLRNGAIGVGLILWFKSMITQARTGLYINSNVYYICAINTPVTLAFLLSPGVNNIQDLSLHGQTFNT